MEQNQFNMNLPEPNPENEIQRLLRERPEMRLVVIVVAGVLILGVVVCLLFALGGLFPSRRSENAAQSTATAIAQAAATAAQAAATNVAVGAAAATQAAQTAQAIANNSSVQPTLVVAPTEIPSASATPSAAANPTTGFDVANATATAVSGGAANTGGIPTVTRSPNTSTKSSGSGTTGTSSGSGGKPAAAPNPFAGIRVNRLRVFPDHPTKREQIGFYVTFVNTGGKFQDHKLCVEIFRPNEKKSMGSTGCNWQRIEPGTHELFINGWVASGIKQCSPFLARAIARDDDDLPVAFLNAQGAIPSLDFSVCP